MSNGKGLKPTKVKSLENLEDPYIPVEVDEIIRTYSRILSIPLTLPREDTTVNPTTTMKTSDNLALTALIALTTVASSLVIDQNNQLGNVYTHLSTVNLWDYKSRFLKNTQMIALCNNFSSFYRRYHRAQTALSLLNDVNIAERQSNRGNPAMIVLDKSQKTISYIEFSSDPNFISDIIDHTNIDHRKKGDMNQLRANSYSGQKNHISITLTQNEIKKYIESTFADAKKYLEKCLISITSPEMTLPQAFHQLYNIVSFKANEINHCNPIIPSITSSIKPTRNSGLESEILGVLAAPPKYH